NGSGSQINAANNGQSDVIGAQELKNEGILSLDLADKIKVKGGVKLDGELKISADLANADFRKAVYKIINYGAALQSSAAVVNVVSGALFSSPAALDYGGYFAKWITLVLRGNLETTEFSSMSGLSYNQMQTAQAFDALSKDASGDLDAVISYIEGLDKAEIKEALYETSGFFIANAVRGASLGQLKNVLFSRTQKQSSPSKNSKIWFSAGFADFEVSEDDEIKSDYSDSSSHIAAGYDVYAKDMFSVGVYAGHNSVLAKQNGLYESDVSNTAFGFYGGYFDWDREFKAFVGGNFIKYHTVRALPFIERTAAADFNGNAVCASFEGVYKIEVWHGVSFEPFLNLNALNSSYGNFKEKGAESLNLNVRKGDYFRSDISGGASILQSNPFYSWRLKAEGSFLLAGQSPEIESFFDGDETQRAFISRGNEEDSFTFGISAYADLAISNSIKIYAGLSYRRGGQSQEFNMNGGFACRFSSPVR
ncbi:MAG: autotransporter outer membrane beta-barrel domain-containing protein, partial [Endomicrobium sp.]|nr:autotransporter outer membrane beta-barrel domain-containing protein [Endomicrobium sp.]